MPQVLKKNRKHLTIWSLLYIGPLLQHSIATWSKGRTVGGTAARDCDFLPRYMECRRDLAMRFCLSVSPSNTCIVTKRKKDLSRFLSAQCVSSIGQIIKSVCVSVSQWVSEWVSHSVSQSFREFWDPLHISWTVQARNFKFGTQIGHWGY